MAAHQAPQSLGFSRQEHWSGLRFKLLQAIIIIECKKKKHKDFTQMDFLVGEKIQTCSISSFWTLDKKYIIFDSFVDFLIVDRQTLVDMTKNM